jgi:hypothetical protein
LALHAGYEIAWDLVTREELLDASLASFHQGTSDSFAAILNGSSALFREKLSAGNGKRRGPVTQTSSSTSCSVCDARCAATTLSSTSLGT